jgi:hypothetical protein
MPKDLRRYAIALTCVAPLVWRCYAQACSISPRTLVGQRQRHKAPRKVVRRWLDIGNMPRMGRGRRRSAQFGRNATGVIGLARARLSPRRRAVSGTTGGGRSHDRGEQR